MVVVASGALAYVFAGAAYGLFGNTFHYNCSWEVGEAGRNGAWVCGDGIGYVDIAIALGGMSALLLLIGILVSLATPSRARTGTYLTLGTVSLVWVAWITFTGATGAGSPQAPDHDGMAVWLSAVAPALAVGTCGLLIGALGVRKRCRGSLILSVGGIALIVVGTIVQPGIGVATFVSAGMLAAAAVSNNFIVPSPLEGR